MPTNASPIDDILIVGPAWVGDMVMAQTLLMQLKANNPNVNIDVLAPVWSHGLLERMPQVRRALTSPFQHKELRLRDRYRLGKSLAKEGYQQAIVLPNSLKSALVPFWANIPIRSGWIKEARWILLNDARRLNKNKLPLMIQRFIALGLNKDQALPNPLPYPKLLVKEELIPATLEKLGLDPAKGPILALCPGAEFGPSKRWPPQYYAEVAKQKIAEGWQVWLFGSPKDSATSAEIQKACTNGSVGHDRCIDLTGRTQLTEAIDLLSLATTVISNDSGLMHIAAALDKPLIVIYGSTSPGFTPPLSKQAKIVSLGIECSPCFQKNCPLDHFRCMLNLPASRVIDLLPN